MDAEEAKECNIVTEVLKEGTADQRVLIECEKLATKSSLVSLSLSLLIFQFIRDHSIDKIKCH